MPNENPLKGHTSTLTDGDFILSPSLTNLYEASHGNGILLLEDGSVSTSSLRRNVASLPGAMTANVNVLTIRSGYAVIDGLVVDFGGGYNSNAPQNYTLELRNSTIEGSNSALTSGQTCLLVVYVSTYGHSDYKHIHVEMGAPVSSGFPVTPEAFLADPLNRLSSKQSTVLAVIKCEYSAAGGGGNNDLDLNVTNVYDMRTFVNAGPKYFAPMTKDVVGTYTNRISDHSTLDGMHGGGDEAGSFTASPYDAIWASKNTAGDSVLYYSGDQASSKRTWRLGPDIPLTYTGGSDQTFKFDEANVFHLTPSQSIELNPRGTFPIGHMIFVYNFSSHIVEFNETVDSPSALSGTEKFDIAANTSIICTFNGSVWKKTFVSTNVTSTAHGAAYRIQISNGSGSHTSDAGLTYNAGTDVLTVTGKAAISGLIQDPTGLELTAVGSNPGSTAGDTLWLNSGDSNRLYQGATKILRDGDAVGVTTIVGLTDVTPNNFSGAANHFLQVNGAGNAVIFNALVEGDIPTSLPSVTTIGPSSGTLTVQDNLTVTGDLTVSGDSTTVNVGTLTVEDKHIEIAKGVGNDAAVDGGGIILDSSQGDKTILWDDSNDAWEFNQHIYPSADSQFNLGSAAVRFANAFTDTLRTGTLTVDTGGVTVDTDTLVVDASNDRVGINQATPLAPLHIADGVAFGYATGSSGTGSDAAVDIVLFAHANFRGAKLLVSIENSTDSDYAAHEIVITPNCSTAYTSSAYAQVKDASQTFCTVAGVLSGSNIVCRITPGVSSKAYSFAVSWQAIKKLT